MYSVGNIPIIYNEINHFLMYRATICARAIEHLRIRVLQNRNRHVVF